MTLQELNRKDVIRESTGENLGRIDDVYFEPGTAKILSVILRGKGKCFGLLGREEDLEISWNQIRRIGADVVIVEPEREGKPVREREHLRPDKNDSECHTGGKD